MKPSEFLDGIIAMAHVTAREAEERAHAAYGRASHARLALTAWSQLTLAVKNGDRVEATRQLQRLFDEAAQVTP